MKRPNHFLSALLALILCFSLSAPALAAAPLPETLESPPPTLVDPPVTVEEATSLLSQLEQTAPTLHLSADSLDLQAGKYYEIAVLPVYVAQPLGWKINKVEFSNSSLVQLCTEVPQGVEVISTTKAPVPVRDTSRGTPTGLSSPAFFEAELNDPPAEAETESEHTPEQLSFIIKALRTGHLEFRVTLTNPVWEWLDPTNPLHTQVRSTPEFAAAQTSTAPSNDHSDRDHRDDAGDTGSEPVTPPVIDPIDPDPAPEPAPDPEPDPWPDDPCQFGHVGHADEHGNCTVCGRPMGNPNPVPDPEPPQLLTYDTSEWLFDADSLQLTYDGEGHLPTLNGVPAEVEYKFYVDGQEVTAADLVNAGAYSVTVKFTVPEGYSPVADFSTNLEIEPAHIQFAQGFDRDTGAIVPVLSGVIEGDVANVTTDVNGDPHVGDTIEYKPGSYTVSTSVAIEEGKQGNYVFDDAPSQTTLLSIASDKPWFKIEMSSRMEDGNIIIDLNMADLKVEQVGTTKPAGLEFNLDYDHDRLEYVKTNEESGYWHMFYSAGQDKEFGYYYGSTGPLPADATICHLTFKVKDGASSDDLIIAARDAKVTAAPMNGDAMEFIYKTADTAIVVNPTGAINVETIVVSGNPIDDTEYRFEHRLENADGTPNEAEIAKKEAELRKLEKYVQNTFPTDTAPANDLVSDPNSTSATDATAEPPITTSTPVDSSVASQPAVASPVDSDLGIDSNAATIGSGDSSDDVTDDQASVVAPAPSTPVTTQPDTLPAGDPVVTEREASSINSTDSTVCAEPAIPSNESSDSAEASTEAATVAASDETSTASDEAAASAAQPTDEAAAA